MWPQLDQDLVLLSDGSRQEEDKSRRGTGDSSHSDVPRAGHGRLTLSGKFEINQTPSLPECNMNGPAGHCRGGEEKTERDGDTLRLTILSADKDGEVKDGSV